MKIIISSPTEVENEASIVNSLIKNDLYKFHLRKPTYNLAEFLQILHEIQPQYLKKIVIHSHFDLIKKYNLGGIHLPEKERKSHTLVEIKALKKSLNQKGMTLSTSFHSIEEAENEEV
jgi:thiamine-phosphate pyrophosphorylase